MRAWEELTGPGRTRRQRRLAEAAFATWDLPSDGLRLIFSGENTTFLAEVDERALAVRVPLGPHHRPGRVLLRVHRDGYQDEAAIRSELAWLAALAQDGHEVGPPVPRPDGEILPWVEHRLMPVGRHVSVMRWVEGVLPGRRPATRDFAAIGRLTARLHEHAGRWAGGRPGHGPAAGRRPAEPHIFVTHDGDAIEEGLANGDLDADLAGLMRLAFANAEQRLAEAEGAGRLHLIHADLHTSNVLRAPDGEVRAIDFDDTQWAPPEFDLAITYAGWHDRPAGRQRRVELWRGYLETCAALGISPPADPEALPGASVPSAAAQQRIDDAIAMRLAMLTEWLIFRIRDHEWFRQALDKRREQYRDRLRRWSRGERFAW